MYQLLRKTDIGSILAWLILFAVLQIYPLGHSLTGVTTETTPSFLSSTLFSTYQTQHATICTLLLYGLVLLLSLHLNYVMIREKMFERKSFIPAFLVVWFATLLDIRTFWNPAFFSSLFLWLAFSEVLSVSWKSQPRKLLFRAGFLCAIAILLFIPSAIFILLFLILVGFLRPFSWQEYSAWLIGLITPWYLSFLVVWSFHIPYPSLQKVLQAVHLPGRFHYTFSGLIIFGLSVMMALYSWWVYHRVNNKLPIGVKKKWNALAFYLIGALICGLFNHSFPGSAMIFILLPICILLSVGLQSHKQKVNIFTFYFLISVAIVVQWVLSK